VLPALADGPTISFLALAQVARERLGLPAKRVPAEEALREEALREEPPRLIIHDDRAKQEFGRRPRQAERRIVKAAESFA
jgi:hypothetical protein